MMRKHKNLDKKIWASEDALCLDVQDILLAIVWDFIDFVRNRYNFCIKNSEVKDIILFGSLTSNFYHRTSDLDICIVLDTEKIIERNPTANIMQNLKLYYYDWAMLHHCLVRGRKVDLNCEHLNNARFGGHYRSGGQYSLMYSKWIYKQPVISDQEFKKVKKEANQIYKQIMSEYRRVKRGGFNVYDIEQLLSTIIKGRGASLDEFYEQTITPMYLAHRKIKKKGIIDKLRAMGIKNQTKQFVLK